jgi:hypothetical protein
VLGILMAAAPVFGFFSAPPSWPAATGFVYAFLTGGKEAAEGVSVGHAAPFVVLNLVLAAATFLVYSRTRTREKAQASLKALRLGSFGPLARKFYFDDAYALLIVSPLKGAAWLGKLIFETFFTGILNLAGWLGELASLGLRRLQTGKANQYAMGVLLATFLLVFFLAGF